MNKLVIYIFIVFTILALGYYLFMFKVIPQYISKQVLEPEHSNALPGPINKKIYQEGKRMNEFLEQLKMNDTIMGVIESVEEDSLYLPMNEDPVRLVEPRPLDALTLQELYVLVDGFTVGRADELVQIVKERNSSEKERLFLVIRENVLHNEGVDILPYKSRIVNRMDFAELDSAILYYETNRAFVIGMMPALKNSAKEIISAKMDDR